MAKRMKWVKVLKWIAALLCLALAMGLGFWLKGRVSGRNDPPRTSEVKRGDLEVHFEELGELAPKVQVDIKSNVTGRVMKLLVDEGDRIGKGDVLAVVLPGRTEAERYKPTEVLSPMAGVILERRVEVGDMAVSGLAEFGAGTRLMTVADLSNLVVNLEINEVDILKLKKGMEAAVRMDAMPGGKFRGKVDFISPVARRAKDDIRVFRVEVGIKNPSPRMKPGMTARIDIVIARREGVLKAPVGAIFEQAGVAKVYLKAGKKKKPFEKVVSLGLRGDMEVEIIEGLSEGDNLFLEKPEDFASAPAKKGRKPASEPGRKGK